MILLKKFIEDLKSQSDNNRNFVNMFVSNKMPNLEQDARYFESKKDDLNAYN